MNGILAQHRKAMSQYVHKGLLQAHADEPHLRPQGGTELDGAGRLPKELEVEALRDQARLPLIGQTGDLRPIRTDQLLISCSDYSTVMVRLAS